MDREHKRGGSTGTSAEDLSDRAPGRRTLLQLERKPGATAAKDPEAQLATAAEGVAGSGAELPHRDAIESSFGRPIPARAHTGAAAAAATAALGAEAYATGGDVAFADASPSLHTAAHEAAHVLQQAGGIQLKGVGQAGDAYEQQADAAADLVVAGQSAAHLFAGGADGAPIGGALQKRETKKQPGSTAGSARAAGFLVAMNKKPAGEEVAHWEVALPDLPPELQDALEGTATPGVKLAIHLRVIVSGAKLSLYLHREGEVAGQGAELDGTELIGAIGGFTSELAKYLEDTYNHGKDLFKQARDRLKDAGNLRLRLDLGKENFLVFDLLSGLRGVGRGSLDGFRPVEGHVAAGPGSATLYGGDEAKEQEYLPKSGRVGDWFELPSGGEKLRKEIFNLDKPGPVHVAVFAVGKQLSIAIKPDKDSERGFLATVDFQWFIDHLKRLGKAVADFIEKLLGKLGAGFDKLLDFAGGLLKFKFDTSFLDFDLKGLLPSFSFGGGGKGFDWSRLIPSGFSFDIGGFQFSGLPSLPWWSMPTLGKLKLPNLDFLRKLSLPDLPSLNLSLPDVDFGSIGDLFAFLKPTGRKGWVGLGFDLSFLKKWMPGLGSFQFGIEIPIGALIEKFGKFFGWVGDKIGDFVAWVKRYFHLGADGVLRIYDNTVKESERDLLGFDLLRLLDGADPADLVPVEIRAVEKYGELRYGEEREADKPKKDKKGPQDKVFAQRPKGKPLVANAEIPITETISDYLGTTAEAARGDLYVDAKTMTATAFLAVDGSDRGVSFTLDWGKLVKNAIAARAAAGGGKDEKVTGKTHVDEEESAARAGLVVRIGPTAEEVREGKAKDQQRGYAYWPYENLVKLVVERDLAMAIPPEFDLRAPGMASAKKGDLSKDIPGLGEQIGGEWLTVTANEHVRGMAGEEGEGNVDVGVFWQSSSQEITVVVLGDAEKKTGFFAGVDIDFVREKLARLGSAAKNLATKFFERLKQLGAKLFRFVSGLLDFDLDGGGNRISFDIAGLIKRLSGAFDLRALLPSSFSFDFPTLGLSFAGLPSLPDLHRPDWLKLPRVGSFDIPIERVTSFLSNLGFPKVSVSNPFKGMIGWVSDMEIAFTIDLSGLKDLFPNGFTFGLKLNLDWLLDKVKGFAAWLKSKLPTGGKGSTRSIKEFVHLGEDGVLRIFDEKARDQGLIGFDLLRLLDGAQPSDLVPVEVIGGHDAVTMRYGDVDDPAKDKQKDKDKTYAERPKGTSLFGKVTATAPDAVRSYFEVEAKARLGIEAFADEKQAQLHVTLDGTDRAILFGVDMEAIARMVQKLPIPEGGSAPKWLPDIDEEMSKTKKGIVVRFGPTEKDKSEAARGKARGYAMWRVESLIAGGFALETLVPDEIHVEVPGKFEVTAGESVAIGNRKRVAQVEVPPWLEKTVDARTADVYLGEGMSFLIADADTGTGSGKDRRVRGIEVKVEDQYIDLLEDEVSKLFEKAASALKLKKRAKKLPFKLTDDGLRISAGPGDDADYVTFGYAGIIDLLTMGSPAGLMPVAMRISGKLGGVEMTTGSTLNGTGKPPEDENTYEVAKLPAVFKDTLGAVGIDPENTWIKVDAKNSRLAMDPGSEKDFVDLSATIFHYDAKENTYSGRQFRALLDLDALLSKLVPAHLWERLKHRKKVRKKRKLDAHIEVEDNGITLEIEGTKGKTTIGVGLHWNFSTLLDVFLNLDKITDRPEKLLPDALQGKVDTPKVGLEFLAGRGKAEGHAIEAKKLVVLTPILEQFLPEDQAQNATVYIDIPDPKELGSRMGEAFLNNTKIELLGVALEIPNAPLFALKLSLSKRYAIMMLQAIPVVGEIVMVALKAYDVLSDPAGSLESLAYAPEALYHIVTNAGDIVDSLKDASVSDIVQGLIFNDMSMKQGVLAMRAYKRLKESPYFKGKMKTQKKDISKALGIDQAAAEKYYQWLSNMSDEDLKKLEEMDKLKAAHNIKGELDFETFDPEMATLDLQYIEQTRILLEAGFNAAKEVRDAPPDAKEKAEEKAKKAILEAVAAYAAKGYNKKKVSKLAEYEEEEGLYQDETDKVLAGVEVEMPGYELGDISGLPEPTKDQWLEAAKLFTRDSGGKSGKQTLKFQRDYLILKYAHLATDKLAALLEKGETDGIKMPEEERWFVRGLFVLRIGKGELATRAGEEPRSPMPDAELVQKWRDGKFGTTPGDKRNEEREAREKRAAKAKENRGKGKGKGKGKSKGQGEKKGQGSAKTAGEGGGSGGESGKGHGVGDDEKGGSDTEGAGGGADHEGDGGGGDEDKLAALEDDLFGGAEDDLGGENSGKGTKKGKGQHDTGTDDTSKKTKVKKGGGGDMPVFPIATVGVSEMLVADEKNLTVEVNHDSANYKDLVKMKELSKDIKREDAWHNFGGPAFRLLDFWITDPPVLVTQMPPAIKPEEVGYALHFAVRLEVWHGEGEPTEEKLEQARFYAYPGAGIVQRELKITNMDLYNRTREVNGKVQFDDAGVIDFGFFKGKVLSYSVAREGKEEMVDLYTSKKSDEKYWILKMDIDVDEVPGKATRININDVHTGMLRTVEEKKVLKDFHIRTFTAKTAKKAGIGG